jgi:two-component system cell cycle response regulator DivK
MDAIVNQHEAGEETGMSNETILIVEDSKLNRKLVETVLRPHDYRLLIAVDGQEALDTATRERPDLILMDMQLPKISGYDATQTLKAQPETADIPIVALTAHAMEDERERAKAAGCDGYITKPINTRTFPEQVKEHLDRHVKRQT